MKINTIINRYIFREIISPFTITLGFLTFVFLLTKIIDITNLVVNCHASLFSILKMLFYSMPSFLEYTLPMSVLMGVLMAFLKMSADLEIVAIKAGGGNIWPLLTPVVIFCSIGTISTLLLTLYGAPWGKYSNKVLLAEMTSAGIEMNLKEGVFNDSYPDVMIYVDKIDSQKQLLKNIFIDDRRNKSSASTVVAPAGKKFFNKVTGVLTLRLFDSIITQVDTKTGKINTIKSKTYDININILKNKSNNIGEKARNEMYPGELLAYIKNPKKSKFNRLKAKMDFYENISIAFACLTMGLLAVPLGVKSAFSRKGSGLGLGFVCFMGYYILIVLGGSLGKSGKLPPFIAMWGPDIVTGVVALYFLFRVSKERSIGVEPIVNFVMRIIIGVRRKKNEAAD